MNVLIIEDEPLVALSLEKLLRQLEPEATIVGTLESVSEAKDWLSKNKEPDLIFSDIQLSDGIALDIFSTDRIYCPIIFTTAYNEYAIRAFKLNSIDYLLKPIDKADMESALKKFHLLQSKFANNDYLRQITTLFTNFHNEKKYKERFAVHMGRNVTLVPVEGIALFTKEEIIYLVNGEGKKFITDYRSLDEVQELLDPRNFYRANRQTIVHLSFVESYRSDDTGKITIRMRLSKIDDIIISKEKAADFKKWFE
ncbi:MAG TPA: LytTR family DNA-binding domain-containing protein [Flavisolibacter sp.]|jgi:DNA-binding LytR/AlgR family response regulator|nr:LytTR family DNA-binding domain-containing protein [Flavisolibacter sp.]